MTETSGESAQLPILVEYVSALAPALAVIAATVAAAIAYVNYLRQQKTDTEEKFWRRLEWAIEMSSSGELSDANMGLSVLTAMVTDKSLDADDDQLLGKLIEEVVSKVRSKAYSGAKIEVGDAET